MIENYDCLIFDCDGVLVNSEQIAQDVEMATLASVGMHYQRDDYARRFAGTSEREFIATLRQDSKSVLGRELSAEFFAEMMVALGAAYDEQLDLIEGASELVSAWPKVKAVASSSSKSTLALKLNKVGLDLLFGEHIYSADDVGKGKPDPAVFLYTADSLGVDPARCLVIEDSANGIIAAKRAGMTAAGFIGGGHCLEGHRQVLLDSGADYVFTTHNEIAAHLELLR